MKANPKEHMKYWADLKKLVQQTNIPTYNMNDLILLCGTASY